MQNKSREYIEGVWAAHEKKTPQCPYNSIYETQKYNDWFDGLVCERRAIYYRVDI